MCLGLAPGYIKPEKEEKLSLLKQDPTESFKETVCDHLCRFPRELHSQDELDEICENCIVDKVKKVEVSE